MLCCVRDLLDVIDQKCEFNNLSTAVALMYLLVFNSLVMMCRVIPYCSWQYISNRRVFALDDCALQHRMEFMAKLYKSYSFLWTC